MKKNLIITMISLLLIAALAWAADTTYGPKVYRTDGGDKEVIASGGTLDIESGGNFRIAGANVLPTAAQLNYLYGASPGNAAANKVVVLSSAGAFNGLDMTTWKVGGTTVSATADQLNYLASVTPGTSAANKVLTTNGSNVLTSLTLTSLNVTSPAIGGANITATAADLNQTASVMGSSSAYTLATGAAGANSLSIIFQAKDSAGANATAVHQLRFYIADDSAGATPATAAANGGLTVNVGGTLKVHNAALDADYVTNANGTLGLTLSQAGGAANYSKYGVVVLPSRKLKVSDLFDYLAYFQLYHLSPAYKCNRLWCI